MRHTMLYSGIFYCGVALCGLLVTSLAAAVATSDATTPGVSAAKTEPDKGAPKSSSELPPAKRPAAKEKAIREKPALPPFTEEREAAALAFVRENHPEVAELLERLKKNRPGQYRKAIRELSQTSQRLAVWKDRDPQRYDLELRLWKLQSKARLLSARASMSLGGAEETELRQVLAEQMDVRIALLKLHRDAAARRVQDLESQIARLTAGRDSTIERQVTRAKQAIDQHRKRKKSE